MFSTKIYVLSVFVFCLFNLGQAAPIIDEVSSLATRELSSESLDARGFLDNIFGKKLSKENQKKVDNATDASSCHLYNAYTALQKSHEGAIKSLQGKMGNSTEDKNVKKAYKKLFNQYKKLSKDAKNEAKKHAKELKKHGVKNVATQCASHSSTHSDEHKSKATPHTANADDQHSLAATSHHGSHAESHSEAHSGQPAPEN